MYDPRQQVYGLPDYISGIHSVLLNSEVTIFRRRYYNNGAHMGFILYTSDPNLTLEMETKSKRRSPSPKGWVTSAICLSTSRRATRKGLKSCQWAKSAQRINLPTSKGSPRRISLPPTLSPLAWRVSSQPTAR